MDMDIQEALTLALRVRRHQFDANTGNPRSSAQTTAQIDPRSASDGIKSDTNRICPYPILCMYRVSPYPMHVS